MPTGRQAQAKIYYNDIMNGIIQKSIKFILDLLFPIACQRCGAEGDYLCLACQTKIEPPITRCLACGKNSPAGRVHAECKNSRTHLAGLLVAADYRETSIQRLIWHMKYNSVHTAATALSRILADYLVKADLLDYFAGAAVIPVPLHSRRQKERGYNQAALLAENLARALGLDYRPILKKIRPTKSQTDLSRVARMENVRDSFAASPLPSLGERKILLIDDVATTGATLNECARELKKQSPAEIWGLVVARN